MKKNIRGAVKAINLVAIFFVVLFGACTDEHYGEGQKEVNPPVIKGDTTIVFDEAFKFQHASWEYSNGLAKSEPYYDGFINYLVNGVVVKNAEIERQIVPMTITWEPISETTSTSAQKPYIGQKAGAEKISETSKNQEVSLTKFERECKLTFIGMEVTLKAGWWKASLGKTDAAYCRYDSTTVATQVSDTVKVNGSKIEVIIDGEKYNRVNVTAKAKNHFTDIKGAIKTPEIKDMDIAYSTLVPVTFVPGDKNYEGSVGIEGTGKYTKVTEQTYKSELKLTHYFTQDGNTLKEEETVSGIANIRTWVEGKGQKMIVGDINIGNPTVSVENTISDLYLKTGFIYAKKYTTVWTYTWANGFVKKVYSEVEKLYYRREVGKEVAMPYGETTTSFKDFMAGNSVEKSEGDKKYNTYPNGIVSFNGAHKSETGNLNNAISGLSVGQEFWVEKEQPKDEFIDFTVKIIPAEENNGTSQIIITENWTVSGEKIITYSQVMVHAFTVSGEQTKPGSGLNFISGLSKAMNGPSYASTDNEQFVRTLTTTYTAKFDLCDVQAFADKTDAYVLYRNEKYFFKANDADVTYEGLNNPTATDVIISGEKYSRKAYDVTFKHSLKGNKIARVNVDKLVPLTPDMPEPWGPIDIQMTMDKGGLSWTWKRENGKTVAFVSGTICTQYGIISFWEGDNCFTQKSPAELTGRVGNSLYPEGSNYLIPSYITVVPNNIVPSWLYTDINGKNRDEANGALIQTLPKFDVNKPFFETPEGEAFTFTTYENGATRVIVKYNDKVIFDHVFSATVGK